MIPLPFKFLDHRLYLGNCFVAALILKLVHGGRIITIRRQQDWLSRFFGHSLVVCRDRKIRHLKHHREVMPFPLCYLIFCGYVHERERGRSRSYQA